MWGAASSKPSNTLPISPGSCFGKAACQLQQRSGGRITAAGPLPMPYRPGLRNSKTVQTFMSASIAVNSISCEFLLMGSRFPRLHPNAALSGNLIQIPGIPQETCRSIQHLVQSGELYWARHLKVNIDLGFPPQKSSLVSQMQSALKCHWKYMNSSPSLRTCPFLVIEVACSESEELVIRKAKEYIHVPQDE